MEISAALAIFRDSLAKFVTFNEDEWIVFIQHLNFISLKKKQYFAVPEKVCDKFAFIVTGSMRYYHIIDGQDITSYFSFEKEFASSYKSYLTGQPGITYIQALEDTGLITISRKDMDLMLLNPLLAFKMEHLGRSIAEYYICCYEDRVASFITQTPEERYLSLLDTGREILQRMPQHYIANFLGITPVSLSRIRRRLMATAK